MSTFELWDAWRARHPDVKEFIWRRANGSDGFRINMIWLPQCYLGLVRKIEISPFLRSDHQMRVPQNQFPLGGEMRSRIVEVQRFVTAK